MPKRFERLAAEALAKLTEANAELDALSEDDTSHEQELEEAFTGAATTLIETKQELKRTLKMKCTNIIADITQLQATMPDVSGPNMSSLEPPFRPLLQRLEEQTQQFRLIAAARTKRLEAATSTIRDACSQLDLAVPALSPLLTESNLTELETQANAFCTRLNERRMRVADLRRQIVDMCAFMAEEPPAVSEALSDRALNALIGAFDLVKSQHTERLVELNRLETQVAQLAELLDVPSEVSTAGTAVDRLKAADLRLAQLNALKRKCIAQVVDKARVKIVESWNALCVDQRRRAALGPMLSQEATETVLEALEAERLSLQALVEDQPRQEIVRLLHEYSELREQERQLAEASRDPKRLAQRGFSQILKREEATRRLLERRKPPLIQSLLPLLKQWSEEHDGESFELDGEQADQIAEQERAKLERRNRTSLPRKRPMSANSQQNAGASEIKRVKISLSTPMLNNKPRPIVPSSRSGKTEPLVAQGPAPVMRHTKPSASRREVPSGPSAPSGPSSMHNPPRKLPHETNKNTPNVTTRSAAAHTAAIRAASRAYRDQRSIAQAQPRPVSQASVAASVNQGVAMRGTAAMRGTVPRTMIIQSSSARMARAGTGAPASASIQRPATAQRPTTRLPPRPQQRVLTQQRSQSRQQVPVGPQKQRQPLAAQPPAILNKSEPNPGSNKALDWRAQRKADLQENGLSYYDDSTTELAEPAPPGEESFNFRHFF